MHQTLVVREVVLGLETSVSAQEEAEYLVPPLGERYPHVLVVGPDDALQRTSISDPFHQLA
jgi:hypothetical protein